MLQWERIGLGLFSELPLRFPFVGWERDFAFARHTTIGCGGTALFAASPTDAESAAQLLCGLNRAGIPYCFLGAGANVLPSDGVFEGVAVRFHLLRRLYADGEAVYAGAGVTGGALLRFACENRLGGFEPFSGIPMTVGGGVTMNAGVAEGHFSDVVLRVVGVEKGRLRTFELADCAFSEKESLFQSGIAVTGAYLRGRRTSAEESAKRSAYFRAKRAHLPSGRSMGCVFVNPAGDSAGRIVEACGLKGRSVGGAKVSEQHANFIVNKGGTAADVAALIRIIKEEVFRQTGIRLREEIRRLP